MSEPFLSEIRIFGFNYPPRQWATCDGQILPINQNQSLYSLLGTRYGGDGRTTFALPDLRGRTPLHRSDSIPLAKRGGTETVALHSTNIPSHTHNIMADASAGASTNEPLNNALGQTTDSAKIYAEPATATPMNPASVASTGADQGHINIQPSLVLNFCIALAGVYPSRN